MKEQIINAALEATGCTREDVFSPAKWEPLPLARYLIAWGLWGVMREKEISEIIGRDRCTLIFGRNLIKDILTQPHHKYWAMVDKFLNLTGINGKAKSGVLEFTSGDLTAFYAAGILAIYRNGVQINKIKMDGLTVRDVNLILKSAQI